MNLSDYRLVRLTEDHPIKQFNCNDEDLNDFLLNECKYYQKHLILPCAVTQVLKNYI